MSRCLYPNGYSSEKLAGECPGSADCFRFTGVIGMTGVISFHEWMRSAMRSRLESFKRFIRMLRPHLDGILAWTRLRLSRGAVEGMNKKIKFTSHQSFGFRSGQHFIAAVYHCCAKLRHLLKPNYTLWRGAGLRFGVDLLYSERWDRVVLRRGEEACASLTHFRLASAQAQDEKTLFGV